MSRKAQKLACVLPLFGVMNDISERKRPASGMARTVSAVFTIVGIVVYMNFFSGPAEGGGFNVNRILIAGAVGAGLGMIGALIGLAVDRLRS